MPPPVRIRQIHAGVVGNTPSRAVGLRWRLDAAFILFARSQEQTHLSGPRLRSTAAAVVGERPAKIRAYEEHFPSSRRSAGWQWQRL
jgi:hypothetical protein